MGQRAPWGWITFHYGRWAYTGDKGWAWIAGRQYSGAWVDWRTPHTKDNASGIVGWGPTPPALVWRISPEGVVTQKYSAFATPYVYARTKDIFLPNLNQHLLAAGAALSVAYTTEPGNAPTPGALGYAYKPPPPPMMDRGLQQAWALASPATASAVGAGPELGEPPHLRSWVVGGPRYDVRYTSGGASH